MGLDDGHDFREGPRHPRIRPGPNDSGRVALIADGFLRQSLLLREGSCHKRRSISEEEQQGRKAGSRPGKMQEKALTREGLFQVLRFEQHTTLLPFNGRGRAPGVPSPDPPPWQGPPLARRPCRRLILLQRIYNFLLLHAILSTVLDYIGLYFPILYYFWD